FCLAQPCDKSHQILLSHRRATCGRSIYSATDVKENRTAIPGHRWIRVMANLNQPAIGEVAATHLFMTVIVGWITWIDYDVSIVIRRTGIVAPNISFGHLMKRIFRSGWQRFIIGENFADAENTRGRTTIALVFSQAGFVLTGDSAAPSHTILPE